MALQRLLGLGFDVHWLAHAPAILQADFASALAEIEEILAPIQIPIAEMIGSGGGEAKVTQRLRRSFAKLGWQKHAFKIEKVIDGSHRSEVTHLVDHVKSFHPSGTLAAEIEWNNKDPFFDRDLANFKALHAEGAISAGIIITRGETLQQDFKSMLDRYAANCGFDSIRALKSYRIRPTSRQLRGIANQQAAGVAFASAWSSVFCADKYGTATTHWDKLMERINRGLGSPCPLLLIALPASVVSLGEEPVIRRQRGRARPGE